jgi:Ribonuclease G/E
VRRLYVAAEQAPVRAGLIGADGRLESYWRFGPGREGLLGARFLGRVGAIDRGLEAAFVEIGLDRPGFLPLSHCHRPPVEGESLVVEVTREAAAGKGVRLTARLGEQPALPAGARAPLRLPGEPPLARLVRRVEGELEILVDARRVAEEIAAGLAGEARLSVAHRAQRDWPTSLAEIEGEAAAALDPRAELPSGGWLLFEPCQTLTVVDVNSGALTPGTAGERAWLKIDLEAAAEIARQLRLRHIGGIVVIDFIDLKSPLRRREVGEALRAAVAGDWEPCWVGGMSRLGLVEMTRRRAGPTLAEMLDGRQEDG